ncbi:hypothetical protein FYJ85_16575 [Victivallaceae bacterium BBE-744-WT-12]|uniref:Uncharacterized protein n=1 Tax=Victivallis lenta TaxID=2606640 RepID=A0A844G5M1_9BACT|nr:hypothetical protein [Victivallis lenta]MST98656.1 hypothetical protein [Victivallis lenta]
MQLQLHGEQPRAFGAEAEFPADRRPLVRCAELQIGEAERLYIGDHECTSVASPRRRNSGRV